MDNPALFYAIAGISMSFAGFAGLFLALRPHDAEWQRYEIGQVNAIVLFALLTMFSALLVIPIATLIGETAALRVVSAVVLVALYAHQVRLGTSWLRWYQLRRDLSGRALFMVVAPFAFVAVAEQVLLLVNVFAPRQELYELALILMLATPALVFVIVVTQLGSRPAPDSLQTGTGGGRPPLRRQSQSRGDLLAGRGGTSELVSQEAASASRGTQVTFWEIGPVDLKGVAAAMRSLAASRSA